MKKLLICFIIGLMLWSCADENKQPIITFDQAAKGAYVRLISETPRELDLANLASAQYSMTIEFVDLEQGTLVSQYDVNATFIDNNPGNGNNSAGPTLVKSFSSGEFGSSDRGFKGLDVTITLSELGAALGVPIDLIQANDQFRIEGSITLTDGQVFTFANSSAAVNGSAFQGHFAFTLKATCPLNSTVFTGAYTMNYLAGSFPFGIESLGDDGKTVVL